MKKLIAAVCALGMCAAAAVPQTICAQEFEEMETSTHGGSSENAADIVHFEDPKLEELILNTEQFGTKIDANEDGVLTKEEMSHLYMLDASGMGITSAEGIQYAGFDAGTSVFDFSDNEITDVTPFEEMMENGFHFFTLNLDNNAITDFSPFFGFTMGELNGFRVAGHPAGGVSPSPCGKCRMNCISRHARQMWKRISITPVHIWPSYITLGKSG